MTSSDQDAGALTAARKREMLAGLLRKRAERTADKPLSIGQERIYRMARLDPGAPFYNVAVAYRLDGALDPAALDLAVRRVAARHDILRTTFPLVDGSPAQHVAPPDEAAQVLRQVDLCDEGDAAVERAISDEAGQSFDLAQGPLWRATLLRLGDEAHVLVLTMHHIVTDGWSFELFLNELGTLYAAFRQGAEDPLSPLALQYADFAARQRAELEGKAVAGQRGYWQEQMARGLEPLQLPGAGGSGLDRAAASHPFSLSADLSRALTTLGQGAGATLFMVMLAGFAALLHRATGQEDLLLCTPVTGRHRAQSKGLIGYFNNILPLRLDLGGDPALGDLVGGARRVALDAYKNQDVPFQEIADLPSLRQVPLSRVLFSLDMEWPPRFGLDGLSCTPVGVDTGTADFDLSVSLWTVEGRVFGNLRYKTGMFDPAAMDRLAEAYRDTLAELAEAPGNKLSSLSPLPAQPSPAAEAAPAGTAPDLPRSALEMRMAQEWEAVFGRHPIGIHDDLQSLGASSLAVASLAERIQRRFHSELPVTAIFRAGTIARMVTLLRNSDTALGASPLAPIHPQGSRPPLFLCEGVGIYYPLVPYLGEDQPIYGLISENAETARARVEDIAAGYREAVLAVQPDGPYSLGGISFGGLVAFEIAQQLVAEGREVALLALFDTPGPDAYRLRPPLRRAVGHARNVLRYGSPYLRAKMGPRLARLTGAGRGPAGSGTTPGTGAEAQQLRRMFHERARNYRVRPYPGRITLFALSHRDGVSDSLFDPALGEIDPLLGWGPVAAQGVELHEIEGEHISILREPFVQQLGEELRRNLDRLQAVGAPPPARR